MKTLQLRLPDGIHSQIKQLAQQEGVSLNQFLVVAASNEAVRQETRDFFRRASSEYDAKAFASALDSIPDAPIIEGDEI
ncbi:hypothetical protein IAD21_04992 [Abditibacteriota bacterium]|nr:hypothetical protein IAD21_04992 [Abditibacteriota bacterium]